MFQHDKNNNPNLYATRALLSSLKFHRNEILSFLEDQMEIERWGIVRKKILDHLGKKGIEGQILEILVPESNSLGVQNSRRKI